MFITDHFVFLHLPKTAGVFIESVCQEDLKMSIHQTQRHACAQDIPDQWKHLPKIGVVRSPWEWHASLFFFAKHHKNNATKEIIGLASDDFQLSFEETLERLMDPDVKFLEAYRKRMTELGGKVIDFECLSVMSMDEMKEKKIGLMSFLAEKIFNNSLDHVWRVETLRNDFFNYIKPFVSRDLLRNAMLSPARNVSNKPDLKGVLTSKSIDLISKKEENIIKTFKYIPPVYKV